MKNTTKKIISVSAALAMAASISTMAFAVDENTTEIKAPNTGGSTTVTLDVTSHFPYGIYTVQIPAKVDLKYNFDEKNWKNTPSEDIVKMAANSDFILEENMALTVTLATTTIKLKNADESRDVDCACSMEDFQVTPGNAFSKESHVTFTANSPSVAEKYTGSAKFVVSTANVTPST